MRNITFLKKNCRRIFLLLPALVFVGCISDMPGIGPECVERSIKVDGLQRTYRLYIPENASGPFPLLLSYHGFLGTAAMQEHYTSFNAVAAREKFVVVYPDGVKKRWNLRGSKASNKTDKNKLPDDVAFTLAIIEDVARQAPIDRSRIFASGMSMGAMFCYTLAADTGDLLAGLAPVAGGMLQHHKDILTKNKMSLIVIQNDKDPLVPFNGGKVSDEKDKSQQRIALLPTYTTVEHFRNLNQGGAKPQITDLPDRDPNDGTTTRITRYPPGPSGYKTELWVIHGGGHCWPGRPTYGRGLLRTYAGKPSRDFDGAEAIWEFLKTCPPRITAIPDNPTARRKFSRVP